MRVRAHVAGFHALLHFHRLYMEQTGGRIYVHKALMPMEFFLELLAHMLANVEGFEHLFSFVDIIVASTLDDPEPQKERWYYMTVEGMRKAEFKEAMEALAKQFHEEEKVQHRYYLPGCIIDVYYSIT
jgi:hypothetical protein